MMQASTSDKPLFASVFNLSKLLENVMMLSALRTSSGLNSSACVVLNRSVFVMNEKNKRVVVPKNKSLPVVVLRSKSTVVLMLNGCWPARSRYTKDEAALHARCGA